MDFRIELRVGRDPWEWTAVVTHREREIYRANAGELGTVIDDVKEAIREIAAGDWVEEPHEHDFDVVLTTDGEVAAIHCFACGRVWNVG